MNSMALSAGNLGIPVSNQGIERPPLPGPFSFFNSHSSAPLLPPFFSPAVAAVAMQNLQAHLSKSQSLPSNISPGDQSLMKSALRLPPIPALQYHPQYRLSQLPAMMGNQMPPPGFPSNGSFSSLPASLLSMKPSDIEAKFKTMDHLALSSTNSLSFDVNSNSFPSNNNAPPPIFPFNDLPHEFTMFPESAMGGPPPGCFPNPGAMPETTGTRKKRDQMKATKRKCTPSQISSFNFIFNKGAPIKLSNGSVKVIEELSINDFFDSVCDNPNYHMKTSRVVTIKPKLSNKAVCITFAVGKSQSKIDLEVNICQPFFVAEHNSWASCDPNLSKLRYNLDCKLLQIGRECLVLIKTNGQPPAIKGQPKGKQMKDSFLMEDLLIHNNTFNQIQSLSHKNESVSPIKVVNDTG